MIIYIGVTLCDEKFNLACLVLPVAIPVGGGSIEHRTIMEGYTASCCTHVLQCIPRYYPVVGRPIYGRQCCPLLPVDKKWSGVTRFPRLGIKGFVGLWGKKVNVGTPRHLHKVYTGGRRTRGKNIVYQKFKKNTKTKTFCHPKSCCSWLGFLTPGIGFWSGIDKQV